MAHPTKPLPHGIDITAPGGIEALLDFHRQTFGDARMSADGGDGGQAPASNDGEGQQPGEQNPAQGNETPAQDGDPEDWQMENLPLGAQQYIRNLRAENKKDRTQQQESAAEKARSEQLQRVAQALGLAEDKPTEETLNEKISGLSTDLEAAQARLADYERRDAISVAADAVKVDAQAALALKDTDSALADVDLADPKAVQDALLTVAEKHPHIKVASTVDRSGGDFQNGSGRPASDPKDLQAALQAAYQ